MKLTLKRAKELLKQGSIEWIRDMVADNERDMAFDDPREFISSCLEHGYVPVHHRSDEEIIADEADCWVGCEEAELVALLDFEE